MPNHERHQIVKDIFFRLMDAYADNPEIDFEGDSKNEKVPATVDNLLSWSIDAVKKMDKQLINVN